MNIEAVGTALSNSTRVRLLRILSDSSHTASSAHREYDRRFSDGKHRESVYRELEKLVERGLVDKHYETESKELRYSLRCRRLELDLGESEVEVVD